MYGNLYLVLVLWCGSTFYFGYHLAEKERESWLLYFMCVLDLIGLCCVPIPLPHGVMCWAVIVAFFLHRSYTQQKKKRIEPNSKIFHLNSYFIEKNANCHKILIYDQIFLSLLTFFVFHGTGPYKLITTTCMLKSFQDS